MTVERVINQYRATAKKLREAKSGGKDGQMDKYLNNTYADIWDAAADILEEEVRQDARWHQEAT